MTYKQLDRERILSYLNVNSVSTVDAIIYHSGAEKLRFFPIQFELNNHPCRGGNGMRSTDEGDTQ